MGPAMGLLLCSLLLLAPGGLRLSSGQVQLEGLVGESVYFPALRPVARDIVRILWFSERQGTHIAEAKPQDQAFNVNFLPNFSNRLAIHAGNLSLEICDLRLEDQGLYRAVVDIASDPTKPRAFSYELSVRERGQEGDRGKGGTTDPPGGGEWRTSTGPPGGGERRTSTGPPGGGERKTSTGPTGGGELKTSTGPTGGGELKTSTGPTGGGERRTSTGPPGGGERRTSTGPPGGGEWRTSTGPPGGGERKTSTGPPVGGERKTSTGPTGGGERRTSTGPPGGGEWKTLTGRGAPVTTGGRTTLAGGDGGGQEGGGSQGSCHCTLKGYVIAAVYVPLCIVVATVHVKTRS